MAFTERPRTTSQGTISFWDAAPALDRGPWCREILSLCSVFNVRTARLGASVRPHVEGDSDVACYTKIRFGDL
jgi:hypothetical protein